MKKEKKYGYYLKSQYSYFVPCEIKNKTARFLNGKKLYMFDSLVQAEISFVKKCVDSRNEDVAHRHYSEADYPEYYI